MAKSSKPRKRASGRIAVEKLKSINYVQKKLTDLCVGSIQAGNNYQYTYYNGQAIRALPVFLQETIKQVRFHWCMIFGVIHRQKNGAPKIEYIIFSLTRTMFLMSEEFSEFVYRNLKRLYEEAEYETKLTTFWLATPNPNYDTSSLMARVISMLDQHQIYNVYKSNYEWDNNISPNLSMHNTTYWYQLIDWVERDDFELIS